VIPAINAKQKRFFTAVYRQNERLTGYMDADAGEIARAVLACAARPDAAPPGTAGEPPAEAAPVLVTGPDSALLAPLLAEFLGKNRLVRDPASRAGKSRALLEFSQEKYIMRKRDGVSFEKPSPVYLRKSDAEVKSGIVHPE
jgi:tRNA A37 threonylcarbamoyladenosine modification protein TsaB